jgi:hypothetical protein
MELNHKVYEIYGAENTPVEIQNPKEVQVLINGKPNGTMLSDIFKKIDDLEVNKIYGWSLLEYYRAEEGFLVDNNGNKINLLEGETQIFFKRHKDPIIILNEKEVSLDYVRDVSALLGLETIEETITGLADDDKQVIIEERIAINEKRQKQIKKEKEEADARETKKLEEERIRLEQEKKEEEERLAKLDEERIANEAASAAEAEAAAAEEEKAKAEAEKAEAEKAAEKAKIEEEEKKKEEEKKPEYDARQFRSLKKAYEENEVSVMATADGKYTFFYAEQMPEDEEPFVVVKRENGYDDIEGEITETTEKYIEFEFKDGGEELVVVLNRQNNSIKVEVIA